jgi:multicomponent K+:H+ antiporter subunit E
VAQRIVVSAPATRDRGQGRPGWLAHPALSVLLAAVWLLLQQSLAPAQLVAAAVFGLVVPRLVHGFIGPAVRLHAPWTMVWLFVVVLWDIVVSNLTVARIVLNPASDPQPAWVPVPLDGTHPNVATLLATIITMTPGTVSCVVDEAEHRILVHALDCDDPPALAAQIKQRYEAPLRRIFEGVGA